MIGSPLWYIITQPCAICSICKPGLLSRRMNYGLAEWYSPEWFVHTISYPSFKLSPGIAISSVICFANVHYQKNSSNCSVLFIHIAPLEHQAMQRDFVRRVFTYEHHRMGQTRPHVAKLRLCNFEYTNEPSNNWQWRLIKDTYGPFTNMD